MGGFKKETFSKGYVQVYTGNGKGKTTAALGLTLRAVAHGMKVYIAQFLKGQDYGELYVLKERMGDLVDIEQFGTPKFVRTGQISDEDYQLAQRGLARVREALFEKDYKIVIMEEANVAMYMGLLDKKEVLDIIKSKPEDKELILTGRYAPEEIIEAADLVTEMREVKHYYQKGVMARPGIEK
ncbi:MAG: cob(I)yrinic acid a,c-diamide adenosyltransferase [Aquificota bacterium]|nr:MAG: cob(I)yrinic acid a,c-diamide adenosyltransferase [Aquificota bacterium]